MKDLISVKYGHRHGYLKNVLQSLKIWNVVFSFKGVLLDLGQVTVTPHQEWHFCLLSASEKWGTGGYFQNLSSLVSHLH